MSDKNHKHSSFQSSIGFLLAPNFATRSSKCVYFPSHNHAAPPCWLPTARKAYLFPPPHPLVPPPAPSKDHHFTFLIGIETERTGWKHRCHISVLTYFHHTSSELRKDRSCIKITAVWQKQKRKIEPELRSRKINVQTWHHRKWVAYRRLWGHRNRDRPVGISRVLLHIMLEIFCKCCAAVYLTSSSFHFLVYVL